MDALSADEGHGAATALLALVRRRLVRPDVIRGREDAFLFDHALIRDATYAAVAKTERARLHEQLARWLDRRGELDEIVGYHLEQAVLNQLEVGGSAEHLVEEASERLARAGRQAAWARDNRAAVSLLTRATVLLPRTDVRRLELECELSVPLKNLWEWRAALDLLDDVAVRAADLGNRRLELRARVEQVWPRLTSGEYDVEAASSTALDAVRVCESEGDLLGLARAWFLLVTVEGRLRGQFDGAFEAARNAAECFARHGTPGVADYFLVDAMLDGSTPVDQATVFCESLLGRADLPKSHEALLLVELAWLRGWNGDLAQARALVDRARAQYGEIGDGIAIATVVSACQASMALLDGDAQTAGMVARAGLEEATRRNDSVWRTHFLGRLAHVAVIERDYERAIALTGDARQVAMDGDVFQALEWRIPRSRALAALDQLDVAEELARETLTVVDATDSLYAQGEARVVLAEVLATAGRSDAAVTAAEDAASIFERKGLTLLAGRTRAQVEKYRRGEPGVRAPLERA